MKRLLTERVDRFGALGQAAVDLVRAEAEALRGELGGNARRLAVTLLFFVAALFVAFWALAALVFALIEVGAQWLPRWAAALAVVAALALVAAILVLVGRWRLSRLESPAATVRRRAEDYREWWEHRLGRGPGVGAAARRRRDESAAGASSGGSSPRPDA